MTTNVAVGRGRRAGDAPAAALPRRTVSTDSIRSIVAAYVIYRSSLPSHRTSNDSRRSNVMVSEDQVDGPISDVLDNRLTTNLPAGLEHAVRALSREFEQRYEQTFRETIGEIFVTPSDAQTSFLASLRSLFSDGIVNWGRVVALFAFSGSLAAYCVEREMPFLVNQVIDWTTAYISTNLASWIHDNGGWVSRLRVLFVCSQVHTVSFWPSCSASELRCSVTHVHTADYVVRVS